MFPTMGTDRELCGCPAGKLQAFSLLELLVVVTVVGILSTLAATSLSTVLRGTRLDTAARMLLSDIDFARQAAFSRNENVQLRIRRGERPETSGEEVFWQWQVGLVDKVDSSFTPLRPIGSFPMGILLDESDTHSPLLAALPVDPTSGDSFLTFRPNGELEPIAGLPFSDLPDWCFTIIPENFRGRGMSEIPDFVAIQIDPLSSRTRAFRP